MNAGADVRPNVPLVGPVQLFLMFWLPRPKRLMRKKDSIGALPAPVKPDLDNLEKSTVDAMTDSCWWHDDAQVVAVNKVKRYHAKRGWPGALIVVFQH